MSGGNPFVGMTDTDKEVLDLIISSAVQKGVAAGLREWRDSNCGPHIDRTEHLESTIYGRAEMGLVGMDERMNRLEAFERRITRLTWVAIGQGAVIIGIILDIVFRIN